MTESAVRSSQRTKYGRRVFYCTLSSLDERSSLRPVSTLGSFVKQIVSRMEMIPQSRIEKGHLWLWPAARIVLVLYRDI